MARSGVSGDFKKLTALARKVESLGGPQALQQLSRQLAEETVELIAQGFAEQRDPYGKAWAPKVISDGRAILTGNTSRLRRGWHPSRVSATGFRVAPAVDYAVYHQTGTGIYGPKKRKIVAKKRALAIPTPTGVIFRRSVKGAKKRRMVPTKARGLPASWKRAYVEVARDFMRAKLR